MDEGHEDMKDLLSGYVEGDLGAAEVALVETHIAECESCANEVRELRELISVVEEKGLEPLPEGADTLLLAAIREAMPAAEDRIAAPGEVNEKAAKQGRWAGFMERLNGWQPAMAGGMAAMLVVGILISADPTTNLVEDYKVTNDSRVAPAPQAPADDETSAASGGRDGAGSFRGSGSVAPRRGDAKPRPNDQAQPVEPNQTVSDRDAHSPDFTTSGTQSSLDTDSGTSGDVQGLEGPGNEGKETEPKPADPVDPPSDGGDQEPADDGASGGN